MRELVRGPSPLQRRLEKAGPETTEELATGDTLEARLQNAEARLRSALPDAAPSIWPNATLVQVYTSWLGYYNSHYRRLRWTQEELVRRAAAFAIDALGLPAAPALDAKRIGMMALKGVEGLVIAETPRASPPPKPQQQQQLQQAKGKQQHQQQQPKSQQRGGRRDGGGRGDDAMGSGLR